MKPQTSLCKPITVQGKTVFSGEESAVTIHPAPAHHGIVFSVGGVLIPAHVDYLATNLQGRTALTHKGHSVAMVEHLLAALRGLDIDNAQIEVDGPEIPMGDGSSQFYVEAIASAGIECLEAERKVVTLLKAVYWSGVSATLVALPADTFKITYTWHAPQSKAFRSAFWEGEITPDLFRDQLSSARTFGFENEVNGAIKAGLIKGASLDAGILIRDDQVVNAGGLRFPDELVRHKVLDVIGDLSLVGAPLNMHVIAVRSGHVGNAALARAIADLLQKEKTNESADAKNDPRCETDCEDSAASLPVFANR